jgi:hypothetical protein
MAHVVVYLQRVPQGLHPASALALNMARDVAEARGATITGLALGDGGAFDQFIIEDASRAGADQIIFAGPRGLGGLVDRLRPVFILVPWTAHACGVLQASGFDLPTPRWVGGPQEDPLGLEVLTAVLPGALPWVQAPLLVEPEYEGAIAEAPLPTWIHDLATPTGQRWRDDAVRFVVPAAAPAALLDALVAFGATAIAPEEATTLTSGSVLWFDERIDGLPERLVHRDERLRVVLFPGPSDTPTPRWGIADWVLPGNWIEQAVRLAQEPWRNSLA